MGSDLPEEHYLDSEKAGGSPLDIMNAVAQHGFQVP